MLHLSFVSKQSIYALWLALVCCLTGCTLKDADQTSQIFASRRRQESPDRSLGISGKITVDGSSTVYPISQAVAEDFMRLHPTVSVSVNVAGTGGGFKRFVADDLDICDASRPIEPDEEELCRKNGVRYASLQIGVDGLSVVVNAKNTWCDCLTLAQLKRIWEHGSDIKKWSDLDPAFPDEELVLYGPDPDSGSFDYFTEVICGRRGNSRIDYQPSSNDNVLIQGVEGDAGALGYFGYAYYVLNQGGLKVIPIAPGPSKSAGIAPTVETILDGTYKPLSRPLFLYVNKKSLKRPEVVAFLNYYLETGPSIVAEVHYIPLPPPQYAQTRAHFQEALKAP